MNITIELPKNIYEELNQIAESGNESLEEVVIRSVRAGRPPSLNKVPEAFHSDLLALNKMDDQQLWEVIQGKMPAPEIKSPKHYLADFPTLRRAYAFALLKWRGHPVPMPSEFFLE